MGSWADPATRLQGMLEIEHLVDGRREGVQFELVIRERFGPGSASRGVGINEPRDPSGAGCGNAGDGFTAGRRQELASAGQTAQLLQSRTVCRR